MRASFPYSICLLGALLAGPLAAQPTAEGFRAAWSARDLPVPAQEAGPRYRNLISGNPILAVFAIYFLEYERVLAPQTSLALSVSYFSAEDDTDEEFGYFSTDGKFRWYPGQALRGFSIGGTAGLTRVEEDTDFTGEVRRFTAFSLGVALDYYWVLGRNDNFAVVLGAGAKRLFSDQFEGDDLKAYPTGRLSIGYAF